MQANHRDEEDEGSDMEVEGDEGHEEMNGKDKADGKKDPKAAQLRKVQNRIAQREFRMRKQAYIRDLEARVQLMSASRDEQVEALTTAIRALIEENKKLRGLLASVSGFIDEGFGGCLQRIGLDLDQFNSLVNRGDTDTIHDAIGTAAPSKGSKGGAHGSGLFTSTAGAGGPSGDDGRRSSMAQPGPGPASAAHATGAPASPTTSTMKPTSSAATSTGLLSTSPAAIAAITAIMPQLNSLPGYGARQAPAPFSYGDLAPHPDLQSALNEVPKDVLASFDEFRGLYGLCTDNPKLQAVQLLSYHLKNKQLDPSYHLPPSLASTSVQRSIPHDRLLDGVIWASLRDALILQKDQYDEREFFSGLLDAVEIHSDDVMDARNWELKEYFLRKFWFLISQDILDITNLWRAQRGEDPLYIGSLRPPDAVFGVGGAHSIQLDQIMDSGRKQLTGSHHQRKASTSDSMTASPKSGHRSARQQGSM